MLRSLSSARRLLFVSFFCVMALSAGRPAAAATAPFDMQVSFQLHPQLPSVELADVSGDLQVGAGGELFLPSLPFATAVTTTIPFSDPPFIEQVVAFNMGVAGGTLGPIGNGFTGTVPLSGTLLFDLFDNLALGNLSLPLSIGGSVLPTTGASNPTNSAALSISGTFSPWIVSQTTIEGTVNFSVTTLVVTGGSRSTTPGGARNINLVAPVILFRIGTPDGSPAVTRQIPGVARMVLNVPEPGPLLLQGAAVAALAGLGVWRRRRS